MVDDSVDIKIIPSDDEEIVWLQMKSVRSGHKISPDQFIMELETYLYETSEAYRERHPKRDGDH